MADRFVGRMSKLVALTVTAACAHAGSAGAQVWEVGGQGLVATTGPQDSGQFGQTMTSGDFDGDGYRDLAVGAPFWDTPGADAGRVQIHFGGPDGLGPATQDLSGGQAGMGLGAALAAGDFDGDGDDELALGAPGWDLGGLDDVGRLYVFDHSATSGWSLTFFEQGGGGMPGTAEAGDRFGEVLAVGDFNDDGRDDLAVGVPHEGVTLTDSGGLLILYGSASGLTASGAVFVFQGEIVAPEQAGAMLGFALAAGDFNDDDHFYDLAVGTPYFDVAGTANAGVVVLLAGGAGGITTTGLSVLNEGLVGGAVETNDHFGWALAAGDFTRTAACWGSFTCRTDLAIGVPGQAVSAATNAGRVVMLRGEGGAPQQLVQGDLVPFASGAETDDRFGSVLLSEWYESAALAGPPAGSPGADVLLVGVPGENDASTPFQGIVHLVFGSATGLNVVPGQWRIADAGLSSYPPAAGDNFGYALALGKFDAGSHADLAIGVPGRDGGASNNGLVQVMYGALFADGFESAGTWNWSVVAPLNGASAPGAPAERTTGEP